MTRESVRIAPETVRGVELIRAEIGDVKDRISKGSVNDSGSFESDLGVLIGLNSALSLLLQGMVAGR